MDFEERTLSYQALYNKYRPQTFDEVVGQKAVTTTLKNALKEDKISHAYLFCGPRGTGKTTMARLFAKALNCDHGIGNQCNECDSCKAITNGDHIDVIEIDAASNSSVESARQLIENVAYQPMMSRFKVYIIDEVHSMSTAAFNALLKTLEEPPSFVVFILATTEPQKVLPTILSRVQRFDFSKVSRNDLITNMKRILTKEKISYEEEALNLIASLSDGGVRDSLSLLDQAVSYCDDILKVDDVNSLFGLLSTEEELKLVSLISKGDAKKCLSLVKSKYEQGADITRLHTDLITVYKDILIYQTTKDETLLEKLNSKQAASYKEDNALLSDKIDYLISSKREYRTADNFLSHFELTLLHLISLNTLTKEVIIENREKTVVEEKVKEEKQEIDEEEKLAKYDSKAELVKKADSNSGFIAKAPEIKEDESPIGYDEDELVNLMLQANKTAREKISNDWDKINQYTSSNSAYEAHALLKSKLVVFACDILLVTNPLSSEVIKINTKKAQNTLRDIAKAVFGKDYHILAITKAEYAKAVEKYRTVKGSLPPREPKIDFGEEKKADDSTSLFNELLGN